MLKQLLLAILLLVSFCGNAQLNTYDIQSVTAEDLAQTRHPQDTTASAAYLYRRAKTWFELIDGSWIVCTDIYTRVKIYTKDGYNYANATLSHNIADKRNELTFSEANTYNLVNGAIEKTPLKEEGRFTSDVRKGLVKKKITLPNVREGSIIEYRYIIKSTGYATLSDFYFQHKIPVNDVKYEVSIPVHLKYNVYTTGYVKINETLPIEVFNKNGKNRENLVTYSAKNVKALKDESYVNNIDNYKGILKHELIAIMYPNQEPYLLSTDWNTIAKNIYKSDSFGGELKLQSYFEKDIKPILSTAATDTDKAIAIFDFVKDRMIWNKTVNFFCDEGVKNAYREKKGNTAEINLMLTAMLRFAGLDANPVLVSTRANGIPSFPSLFAYNYVLAAVKINGKTILLDATSKYAQPNIIALNAINWTGRLIQKTGDSEDIDLMPKTISKKVTNVMATINSNGAINGKIREQYYDYNAYVHRALFAVVEDAGYTELLEKKYNGITVNDYSVTNKTNAAKALVEEYSFTHTAAAEAMGNNIYFSPMLFLAEKENPFKQESREYPIDFIYPKQEKFLITINIPAGYKVASFPEPASVSMEDNIGRFIYNVSVVGTVIQISVTTDINYASVPAQYYATLKEFYQKTIEKQSEKIVLIKA